MRLFFVVLLASLGPGLDAIALPRAPGTELWRHDVGAKLTAQPAIAVDGRIALATKDALIVVDATGARVLVLEDAVAPAQPMWSGAKLWYRVRGGWKWVQDGTSGPLCAVESQSGTLDAAGLPVFAIDHALVSCGPEKRVLAKRRGRKGQVWPLGEGWVTADEWFLETFAADGKPLGGGMVTELGYPSSVTRDGLVLVTKPSGRLDALDARTHAVWRGPWASDGAPLVARDGALVVLGGRAATLVDPPFEGWSVPIPAGARAAALLDDGSLAVLDRLGRIGVARQGTPVWSRALDEPGSALAAHPAGFLLVQDGTHVVALASAPPDASAAFPVTGGLARNGRAQPAPERQRCPVPAASIVGKSIHVDGPALVADSVCTYPALETTCAKAGCKGAGELRWSQPCGDDCLAAPSGAGVFLADRKALRRVDTKGRETKRIALKVAPTFLSASGDGEALVTSEGGATWFDARLRAKSIPIADPWLGPALVARGEAFALTRTGDLERVTPDGARSKVTLLSAADASSFAMRRFGETVCAQGGGFAGCAAGSERLPARSLEPRAAWFGEWLARCDDGRAICATTAGAPPLRLFQADAPIDAFAVLADGTVAVLVDGRRVVAVWPDGSTRWSVDVTPKGEACATVRWLQPLGPGLVVVRACDRVAAIATGL